MEVVTYGASPIEPHRRTKSDSRSKSFQGDSVEVDAIEPAQLRLLAQETIEQHIGPEVIERLKLTEQAKRETLRISPRSFAELSTGAIP